ncbi:hypothetical protein GQ457_09G022180 [Hibiscus cannabinus]
MARFEEGRSISCPPLFEGEAYSQWSNVMKYFIQAQDFELWDIIEEGYIEAPKKKKKQRSENDTKGKLNSRAMHILLCGLIEEVSKKVSTCKRAKEMWEKLERLYGKEEKKDGAPSCANLLSSSKVDGVLALNEPERAKNPTCGKGRILPASIKGTQFKSGVRLRIGESSGPRPKKVAQGMIDSAKSGQFGPLIRELDVVDTSLDEQHNTVKDSSDTSVTGLDWRTNSVFEQPSDTVMQFLLRNKRPYIVAILEPRISGLAADRFIQKSGFESYYRVEAQGFSGGIWLLWRKTVQVDVHAVSSEFIHTICYSLEDGQCFYGSFVYASPNSLRRKDLWAQLLAVDPSNNFPWVVRGDLNVIGSSDERAGGSPRRIGGCHQFHGFLIDSGLVDMYLVEWNEHPDFAKFLQSVWNGDTSLFDKINQFQERSWGWSMDVFGHIGKRKKALLALLRGIDRALEQEFRPLLVRLEAKLKHELDEVLA